MKAKDLKGIDELGIFDLIEIYTELQNIRDNTKKLLYLNKISPDELMKKLEILLSDDVISRWASMKKS